MPDHAVLKYGYEKFCPFSYQALSLVYKKVKTPQLGPYMTISSQNNLGEVTNVIYLGVTSCYQCHIGGNKC